ncbi:MAG: hypothetical protein ACPH9N_04870 [Alteromonas sp.]
MESYLIRAAEILSDPDETIAAKQTAIEVLRKAGYSDADITALTTQKIEFEQLTTVIFLA